MLSFIYLIPVKVGINLAGVLGNTLFVHVLELIVTGWWIIVKYSYSSVFLTGQAAWLATYFLTFYCDPYLPFQIQNFCNCFT